MADETIYLWADGSRNNPPGAERPRLEVYPPTGAPTRGVVILPGGGYMGQAPHEGEPFARLFAAQGMLALVCYYRVAPRRFPAPMYDAARAMRLAKSLGVHWGVDASAWALMGFSAGGHLAAATATHPDAWRDAEDDLAEQVSARPDRLILAYPVISMVRAYHHGSAENLLGPHPSEERRRAMSHELHVTPGNPPTFLFHTADDEAVPASNSVRFAEACWAQGVSAALHIYPSGPHGVGLAEDWPALRGWTGVMLEWLKG